MHYIMAFVRDFDGNLFCLQIFVTKSTPLRASAYRMVKQKMRTLESNDLYDRLNRTIESSIFTIVLKYSPEPGDKISRVSATALS